MKEYVERYFLLYNFFIPKPKIKPNKNRLEHFVIVEKVDKI